MATTVKRRGVKAKAAPAKAAPAAKSKGVQAELSAGEERAARIEAQTKEVVKLRNADGKWSDIAEAVGITSGRAIFLYECATVPDDERISFRNDAELGKKLLKIRGTMSWGKIAARTGLSEAKCKRLFVEAGGDLDDHIGKGGRVAGGGSDKPVVKTRKAAAPKATGKTTVVKRRKAA